MKCALCQLNEADKSNTHYLTDGIIRSCLNEDGVNIRGKGFMFDVSNKSPFIDFKFQQETSQKALLNAFGREPNDEEIEKAKEKDFAVDYIFCAKCEKLFTDIENDFIQNILPTLRGHDFAGQTEIYFKENILIRKFFLLQVWRTAVCVKGFNIPAKLQESIRIIILNPESPIENIIEIPLNITYLNTVGDEFEYTKNLVGYGIIDGNHVIFFNDFIIQIFPSIDRIHYIEFFGLNDEKTFPGFTNYRENEFGIKIVDNQKRIEIAAQYYVQEKIDQHLQFYRYLFIKQHVNLFGYRPAERTINMFINGILNGKDTTEEMRYSISRFMKYGNSFFNELIRIHNSFIRF